MLSYFNAFTINLMRITKMNYTIKFYASFNINICKMFYQGNANDFSRLLRDYPYHSKSWMTIIPITGRGDWDSLDAPRSWTVVSVKQCNLILARISVRQY